MKNIWRTKEFKQFKERKIKDRCERCGSEEKLGIHHEVPFRDSLEKAKKEVGYYERLEKAMEKAKKEYFNEEAKVTTICKKCHFIEERGLRLCEYCKKKYYNPLFFDSCADCKSKAKEDIEKEMEMIERNEEEFFKRLDLEKQNN